MRDRVDERVEGMRHMWCPVRIVARRRTDVRQRARAEQGAAEDVSPPCGWPAVKRK
jgi:hypothetical protein